MSSMLPKTKYSDLIELAQDLYSKLDGHIILGIPIGIGKPTQMVNALYDVAKNNPDYQLDIHTALSLGRPTLKSDLEKRLLEPFFDRQFKDVPELHYVQDTHTIGLPKNVTTVEFYFKPGEMLKNNRAQQSVLSANYTHVARDMMSRKINLVTQMIAVKNDNGKQRYSLSSNPDVTLDLQQMMRTASKRDGQTRITIAQVNSEMPFMPHDAEVSADFFDYIHDDPKLYKPLFCTPHQPISYTDHMIGFYTSALIKDGGTLQIGIGSLGDAVVNSLLVRHSKNDDYRELLDQTNALSRFPSINTDGGFNTFKKGLYGNTEMLVPGYMALKQNGILKRKVFDDYTIQKLVNNGLDPLKPSLEWLDALIEAGKINPQLSINEFNYLKHWGILRNDIIFNKNQLTTTEHSVVADLSCDESRTWIKNYGLGKKISNPILIHAGFFVGNSHFYEDLRNMPEDELNEINMTSVSFTNQLSGNEKLKLEQRHHARFINACMKMTLSGAAISDGLADGKVVSGVGGQFNFITMGQDIPEARSILMMRSCRPKGNSVVSNIVFNYGHTTIPRHMRDIVITEYGIADLRAKNDQEIITELLMITDARFQQTLIRQAQNAGKLPLDYVLPSVAHNNTPEHLTTMFKSKLQNDFTAFPFGKELTDQEVLIGGALRQLKAKLSKKWPLIPALLTPAGQPRWDELESDLKRMGLYEAKTFKERIFRRLVASVLPTPAQKKLSINAEKTSKQKKVINTKNA